MDDPQIDKPIPMPLLANRDDVRLFVEIQQHLTGWEEPKTKELKVVSSTNQERDNEIEPAVVVSAVPIPLQQQQNNSTPTKSGLTDEIASLGGETGCGWDERYGAVLWTTVIPAVRRYRVSVISSTNPAKYIGRSNTNCMNVIGLNETSL